MTPGDRSAQLISETLDSVVTRATRNAILARALRDGGIARVPGDPDELRKFVHGPLAAALTEGLGADLAESLLDEITLVTQLRQPPRRSSRTPPKRSTTPPPRRNTPTHRISAQRRAQSSSQPMSSQPPLGTLTPPPLSGPISRPVIARGSNEFPVGVSSFGADAHGQVACVLVVSMDAGLAERLTPWLDGRAELIQVQSVRELFLDIEALDGRGRLALLIDCQRPSIRPTAIAALAEELPDASVLLWGATAEQEQAVRAVSPAVARWIVVQAEVRPKELAARCVKAIG